MSLSLKDITTLDQDPRWQAWVYYLSDMVSKFPLLQGGLQNTWNSCWVPQSLKSSGIEVGLPYLWQITYGFPDEMLKVCNLYMQLASDWIDHTFKSYSGSNNPLEFLLHEESFEVCSRVMFSLPRLVDNGKDVTYIERWTDKVQYRTTSIGRYLTRVLLKPEDSLYEIQKKYKIWTGEVSAILFKENNDLEGWAEIYENRSVASCMNNPQYGAYEHKVYRCYCTSAYGLPDNGLRLAYLEGKSGNPSSRAIVHQPSKTFVSVYGESLLADLLRLSGYQCVSSYPEGLTLVASINEDKNELFFPYVDGSFREASIHTDEATGLSYWKLTKDQFKARLSDTGGYYGVRC